MNKVRCLMYRNLIIDNYKLNISIYKVERLLDVVIECSDKEYLEKLRDKFDTSLIITDGIYEQFKIVLDTFSELGDAKKYFYKMLDKLKELK